MANPLVALGIEPQDIGGSFLAGQQASETRRTSRLSNMINEFKLREAQQTAEKQTQIEQLIAGRGAGAAAGREEDVNAIAGRDPELAQKLKGTAQTQQDSALKNAHSILEFMHTQAKFVDGAPAPLKAAAYGHALQEIKKLGGDTSGMPQEWGPDAEAKVKNFARPEAFLSAKDEVAAAQSKATLAQSAARDKATDAYRQQRLNIETANQGSWTPMVDTANGNHPYLINTKTGATREVGADGTPYTPKSMNRPGTTTARSGQAIYMQKFIQENPDASADDIARAGGIYAKTVTQVGSGARADTASLTNVTRLMDASNAQNGAMEKALTLAESLMDKGAGTSAGPVVNRWLQAGRRATGDPDVAAFDTAIKSATNEYGKIITGAVTGGQAGTDTSRAEAARMLDLYQSPKAIKAQMGVIRKDAGYKRQSYLAQREEIQNRLGNGGTAAQPTPQQETGAVPAVTTQQEYDALPSNTIYTEPDGQQYRKP